MTRMRLLTIVGAGLVLCSAGTASAAIQTFFGEDLHNNGGTQIATFPNAAAAETSFLSNLVGVGTETFETQATGNANNRVLTFPGAGTATLTSAGSMTVVSQAAGATNGVGRYGITRDGGNESYLEVDAGANFVITFSQAVAAFGFYGIDIGDFGGTITLTTTSGVPTILNVPNTQGSNGSTDGSVLFYGFIATTVPETFTAVSFATSTGQGDFFGFDDFTIGSLQQVQPPVIPEPMSMFVWGALISCGLVASYRARNRRAS